MSIHKPAPPPLMDAPATSQKHYLKSYKYVERHNMLEAPSRQASIEEILTALVNDGSFACAVVASIDGLPIAIVGPTDAMMIAAVAASMKDLAERVHKGLTQIVTRDHQGSEIVSRYFSVDNEVLLLSIKTSPKQSYRRLTSKAIRKIRQVLVSQR